MEINHSIMRSSGEDLHAEGGEFSRGVSGLLTSLDALLPYFGNVATDEAAQTFRRGADGYPGFDAAYDDLSTALHNLARAYQDIGAGVVAMSDNVKAADWASTVDTYASVGELVEFARRGDDEIAVPTSPVELS
ncbi:hypothetical protein ACFQYP_12785 [Nonomuraea antimicrobica]|uniref:hypothetical protein n=1 Tax=Nonomuraea antimicrobica TaxID=561173 RepID=UPI0031E5239F